MKYIGMIFGVLLRDKYIIQLGDVMMTVKLHNIYAIILLGIIVNIFLLDWIHSILLLCILTKKTWTLMSYRCMLNVFSQHHTWIQLLLCFMWKYIFQLLSQTLLCGWKIFHYSFFRKFRLIELAFLNKSFVLFLLKKKKKLFFSYISSLSIFGSCQHAFHVDMQ